MRRLPSSLNARSSFCCCRCASHLLLTDVLRAFATDTQRSVLLPVSAGSVVVFSVAPQSAQPFETRQVCSVALPALLPPSSRFFHPLVVDLLPVLVSQVSVLSLRRAYYVQFSARPVSMSLQSSEPIAFAVPLLSAQTVLASAGVTAGDGAAS